jgi:transposase
MGTSPDTLLRVIKAEILVSNSPDSTLKNPTLTKIGLDEWSWKKGQTFGSIIVDLTTNRVVDLLQDRSGQTVKKWLLSHPTIELISRDRSTEFALAVSEAAPRAIQVADRFHIVRNLAEQVELLLARLRKEWRPALGIQQLWFVSINSRLAPKPYLILIVGRLNNHAKQHAKARHGGRNEWTAITR